MGFSNMMIAAAKSMPKSTITQSIPSFTYSSCSTTNMWWLKNCWSFSLTKLIEICSKPLYSKISNPAMSNTAQKFAFLSVASIRVSLHFSISHLKTRSNIARAIPPVAPVACSMFWPLVTHSVPTLILGLQKTQTYHKKCFSCNSCKRPLDSVLACDAPDKDIYCRGCYAKKFGARGYGYAGGAGGLQTGDFDSSITDRRTLVQDTKTIQGNKEDKETCPRCNGKVFHAEKMMSKKHCFHKKCFTCMECQRPLDSMTFCDSPEGEIFCRLCYGKNFGPHGYRFGGAGSVPALMAAGPGQFEEPRSLIDFHPNTTENEEKAEGDEGCKRCGYKVFDAEKP